MVVFGSFDFSFYMTHEVYCQVLEIFENAALK